MLKTLLLNMSFYSEIEKELLFCVLQKNNYFPYLYLSYYIEDEHSFEVVHTKEYKFFVLRYKLAYSEKEHCFFDQYWQSFFLVVNPFLNLFY